MMGRLEIEELDQSGDGEAGELVPTIVTAKHFDFFKGEPVTRVRPAIFDDGELADQSASILKAFLNPSEEDATIWARWGCSEFDTGSSRQVCNNAYDKHFEAELVSKWKEGEPKDVSSDDFRRLIRPSFRQVKDDEDLLAVGSRTHFVLCTGKRVYFRQASDEQSRVPWWTYANPKKPDLFNQKCKGAFGKYKKDLSKPVYPAYFEDDIKWSMDYLKRLMHGQDVPTVSTIIGAGIFPAEPNPSLPRRVGYDERGAHLMGAVASAGSRAASSSGLSDAVAAAGRGRASELSDVDKDEPKAIYEATKQQFLQRNTQDSGALVDLMSPPSKALARGARRRPRPGGQG